MSTSSHPGKTSPPPTGVGERDIVIRDQDDALFAALGEAIANLQTKYFPVRLARLLELATAYESAVFIGYFMHGGAVPLYSNLSPDDQRRTLDPYFNGAYLLDPWYKMILDGAPDGVYRLVDCAPENFARTEYYREYYANIGLHDECALFVRLNDTACIVLSLGTRRERQATDGNLAALSQLLTCIRPLCVRHWGNFSIDCPRAVAGSIEELCVQIGLSEREIDVTTLLLRGYSNKLIARNLDISPETVKIYRKRINRKLGTSSTREVFARFFPALP